MPHALRVVALSLVVVVAAWPALAASRVALVIGNAEYESVPGLANPVNDARDISDALESLGFQVFTELNATKAGMEARLEDFAGAVRASDVALFYYAGHAFQVGGQNQLVPVDLETGAPEAILEDTLPLDRVMEALDQAGGLKLVFLDACRDNPLGLFQEGLARIGGGADRFVSYATQPGAVAFDGEGRNGTFTASLLSHIHTPGQTLTELMIKVRRDVIAATGGQQIPWEDSSLTRRFEFREGLPATSPETLLYQVAARTGNRDLMALYLDRYPEGAHAGDVSGFLQGVPEPETATGQRSLAGADPEGDQLWLLAQRTRLRRIAEYYLELYPDGRHREAALAMANNLPEEIDLGNGRLCEELATHPRDATANTAGVPFSILQRNAGRAVEICAGAVEQYPEAAHFVALLARATAAAGRTEEALALYREAAGRGDLRAMVSLGLLMEQGEGGVPRDPQRALELFERAAEGGSTDGAINLAVALFQGESVPADPQRAVRLFRQASEQGSAIATYNLGILAKDGALGEDGRAEALPLLRQAARLGEPRSYLAAAVLLDRGEGVPADPDEAANMLLRGAASDSGEVISLLTENAAGWDPATIRAVQSRLKEAGYYVGALDGIAGRQFERALKAWRNGGFDASVLGS